MKVLERSGVSQLSYHTQKSL